MKIKIDNMWSPDLNPTDGVPDDLASFEIGITVSLSEIEEPGSEVFYLTVCDSKTLCEIENGRFVSHTLVLEQFSWDDIKYRIEKLLRHTESAKNWDEVILALSGCLRYSD